MLQPFYYMVLITIQHYRDATMGGERQSLPYGLYEKTHNINLKAINTTDNLICNGCYYNTRFRPISDVRSGLR